MKTSAGLFLTDILPHKRRIFNKIVKNKVFKKDIEAKHVFAELKKSGVDGIELFLPSYAKKITFDDIKEVKKLLDSYKTPILSVHQALRFFTKTKIAEITQLFHIADLLEAKVIVLHISTAGKQVFDKQYIETLHSLEKKYGIKVGFENREKILGSNRSRHTWHEDAFPEFVRQMGFNMTLDTTHLAQANGDIVAFFKKNKDHIVNIHLSDYKKHYLNGSLRTIQYNRHLPLGKGSLPVKKFLQALVQEGYKGLITMEIHTDLAGFCDSATIINSITKGKKEKK